MSPTLIPIASRRIRPLTRPPGTGLLFAVTLMLCSATGTHAAPDLQHSSWTELLQRCVIPVDAGNSTGVDYGCFKKHEDALDTYVGSLAGVSAPELSAMSRDAQLAFLINAYNAWTVKLILQAWPDLESIKDLGTLLRSPWKKSFIPLLGSTVSLDDIEHGMIREAGRFDEPRIHFAVNCASIGCPALRREAFRADDLESQLEDQTRSFLGDRSRNRVTRDELEVSSLFKWYGDDFGSGWRGARSVADFLALYADALELSEEQRNTLSLGKLDMEFLAYDWRLNSVTP